MWLLECFHSQQTWHNGTNISCSLCMCVVIPLYVCATAQPPVLCVISLSCLLTFMKWTHATRDKRRFSRSTLADTSSKSFEPPGASEIVQSPNTSFTLGSPLIRFGIVSFCWSIFALCHQISTWTFFGSCLMRVKTRKLSFLHWIYRYIMFFLRTLQWNSLISHSLLLDLPIPILKYKV